MCGIKHTSKWKIITLTKLQKTERPPTLLISFVKKLVKACSSDPGELSSRDAKQTQLNLHILCCICCSSPMATTAFVLDMYELAILQVSVCSRLSPSLFCASSLPSQTVVFTFCFDIWAVFLRPCLHLLLSDDPFIHPAAATSFATFRTQFL